MLHPVYHNIFRSEQSSCTFYSDGVGLPSVIVLMRSYAKGKIYGVSFPCR